MDNWDEIRTAYHVGRAGTVSGAAQELGVHHATVIRHIDALEDRLGARLFQRHARGYTPTDAGRELLKVAQTTEDQFAQMALRIAGASHEISGELVITSLPGLAELVTPTLVRLQIEHPALDVRYISDSRIFRLEYGEAHVAIRAGARPEEPDNVVQPLSNFPIGLYGTRDYLARHGVPESDTDLARHRFIGPAGLNEPAPYHRWLSAHVPASAITFRTNDATAQLGALTGGTALGFLPLVVAEDMPDLVQVLAPRPEWDTRLWLVTHVDLHRAPRIQAFLKAVKDDVRGMTGPRG